MASASVEVAPVRHTCRCPKCNLALGTRTQKGIRFKDGVTVLGSMVLRCPLCKFVSKQHPLSPAGGL